MTMSVLEQDKRIVDEFRKVLWKYRSIGAIRMVHCLRFALEKENGYAPSKKKTTRRKNGF